MAFQGLIFNLGNGKTGTCSLNAALIKLGYNSIHDWNIQIKVEKAIKENKDWLYYIKEYNAFSEAWTHLQNNFEAYDKRYPNSKFILTIREINSWIKSRIQHHRRAISSRQKDWQNYLSYKGKEWNEEYIREQFIAYNKKVQDYFKHNLLVINICEGEGWETLCNFLDKPIPSVPFPKENVNPRRQIK